MTVEYLPLPCRHLVPMITTRTGTVTCPRCGTHWEVERKPHTIEIRETP